MFAATSQKVLLAFCILIYYAIFAASLADACLLYYNQTTLTST